MRWRESTLGATPVRVDRDSQAAEKTGGGTAGGIAGEPGGSRAETDRLTECNARVWLSWDYKSSSPCHSSCGLQWKNVAGFFNNRDQKAWQKSPDVYTHQIQGIAIVVADKASLWEPDRIASL
jgi:hypothetical protein